MSALSSSVIMSSVATLLAVFAACNLARASDLMCAYMYHDSVKEMPSFNIDDNGKESSVGKELEILPDNKTIICEPKYSCFALWEDDPQNSSQTLMLAQGCWDNSDKTVCAKSECVANIKVSKPQKFCCCSGFMCNTNVSVIYVPSSDDPEIVQPAFPYVENASYNTETVIISIICALGLCIIILVIVYRFWPKFHKPSPDSLHVLESNVPACTAPSYDLSTLKLQELIGRGRYGCVWKASLNNRNVAAKVFQPQHRPYFLNEKDIYTLPYFEHASLPKFFGSEERMNGDGRTEYLIVLSYAPFGCLQDYLRSHVIDWHTLCKMGQTIAKGLAHLHLDIRKDKFKPCVSHRDLNSRNVLVKEDLTCFICDMGFAMKISGSKYYGQNGEEQQAETTSLTDVGTLRYMAPEVLEGAVNLRDCESSLKQIDVYALGLVLWEIMTRCEDLYQGLEVPEYRMPFEAEIGIHPTFEQMQVLISRNKARPLFSEMWKDSNQAVRLLKETIEDCWDQDAEARLTSLCVEERLQELPILWERHKINIAVTGVSPTVNPMIVRNSSLIVPNMNATTNIMSVNQDTNNLVNSVLLVDLLNPLPRDRASSQQPGESSTSEATVETTVTMSPSEPLVSLASGSGDVTSTSTTTMTTAANKNANSQQQQQQTLRVNPVPLQPHQGRNPCIERNMIMEPLVEASINGNTFVESGSKFKNLTTLNNTNNHNNVTSTNVRDIDVNNMFDILQMTDNVESNALVSNDALNFSTRTCNPIPYVQNAVRGAFPTRPKQPNVPGNGQHYDQKTKKGPFRGRFDRKKGTPPPPGESKTNQKKSKDWGIKSFLERKRSGKQSPMSEDSSSSSNGVDGRDLADSHPVTLQNGSLSLAKSNLVTRQEESGLGGNKTVPTEVCLLQRSCNDGTRVITRPMNGLYKSLENGFIANGSCRSAEVGVAHLAPTILQNGQAPVVKHRSSTSSTSTSSNGLINCHSESDLLAPKPENKLKRPTTLPLKGHASSKDEDAAHEFYVRKPRTETKGSRGAERAALLVDEEGEKTSTSAVATTTTNNSVNGHEQITPRAKIVKRIKTPFKLKNNRFSLYDDRIMGSSCEKNVDDVAPSAIELRGCNSLPVDIDALSNSTTDDVGKRENADTAAVLKMKKKKKMLRDMNSVNCASTVGDYDDGEEGEKSRSSNGNNSNGSSKALKNGLVGAKWPKVERHFKVADSANDMYQVSCL